MEKLMRVIEDKAIPVEIFADSGAYSAMTKGVDISIVDYAGWLREWDDCITTYAALDVIGDGEKTMRNFETMRDLGLNPLPIFHAGTPWKYYEQLTEEYPYIAIGGVTWAAPRNNSVTRFFTRLFLDNKHKCQFHGFGITSWANLRLFPWYSMDSTTWMSTFIFGKLSWFDNRQKKMVQLTVRKPERWSPYSVEFRRLGVDWKAFAYPKDGYYPPRNEGTFLSVIGYKKLEWFLRQYHGEQAFAEYDNAPAGNGPGPKIFLAMTPGTLSSYLTPPVFDMLHDWLTLEGALPCSTISQ